VSHRILVVEDNLPNRELLCDWLESEGHEAVAASSLDEAFAVLKSDPPRAILLDVQLGSDDGLVLAAWLRQQPGLRETPIIAVTAHAMITDHERVLQAGCNACVSKPVDFRILAAHLERWLRSAANVPPRT